MLRGFYPGVLIKGFHPDILNLGLLFRGFHPGVLVRGFKCFELRDII